MLFERRDDWPTIQIGSRCPTPIRLRQIMPQSDFGIDDTRADVDLASGVDTVLFCIRFGKAWLHTFGFGSVVETDFAHLVKPLAHDRQGQVEPLIHDQANRVCKV